MIDVESVYGSPTQFSSVGLYSAPPAAFSIAAGYRNQSYNRPSRQGLPLAAGTIAGLWWFSATRADFRACLTAGWVFHASFSIALSPSCGAKHVLPPDLISLQVIGSQANLTKAFNPMIAIHAWKQHRALALAALTLFGVIGVLAAAKVEPKYESESSIFLRLGRESSGLDPTATLSEMTPIYETRAQEVNSALQVMNSRKILEAVIGVIGADTILNPSQFDSQQWKMSLQNASWPELDPSVPHTTDEFQEKAVEAIYKSTVFESERDSNVIIITSTSKTPELAQAITTTILQAFQAEHVRLNETSGFDFFAQQVQQLQNQLNAARDAVADRKTSLKVMSIPAARARLESVLTEIEKQLNAAIPELSGAKASVAVLKKTIPQLPELTQPMDAKDDLKKRLMDLQQKQGMLLTKYTPNHFRVKDLRAELQLVRNQLDDPANRNAANPARRELEVSLTTGEQKVAETAATIQQLKTQQQEVRDQLLLLNSAETEMAELEDRVADLKEASIKATQRLEQARVLEALSRERISNIRVVQPPTFNPLKMGPSKTLIVGGSFAIGLLAAFILPALWEFVLWYLNTLQSASTMPTDSKSTLRTME